MNLAEGFRVFYRRLATELYVQFDNRAVELVVSGPPGFPDEDIRHFADTLALLTSDGFGTVCYHQIPADLHVGKVGEGSHVYDLRPISEAIKCEDSVLQHPGVVFIRYEKQPSLGCPKIRFDRDHRIVFDAVTSAFQEIIELQKYSGQALEMPARYLLKGFRAVTEDFSLFSSPNAGFSPGRIDKFVEVVASGWRYLGGSVDPSLVHRWLNQFQGDSLEGAIALLAYIHASGYYSTREIAIIINDMLEKNGKGAQLVSIQPPGKSEHMLLYEMRKSSSTIPLQKLFSTRIQHFVCIDDVVGSGDTIIDCLFGDSSCEKELTRWLASDENKVTILAAIANPSGIQRIESDPRSLGKIKVYANKLMGADEGIFSIEEKIFTNSEMAQAFRRKCEEIGRTLLPGDALGWGGCAWGVVTEYNVPDCSLPVIWGGDASIPWEALFPRR